MSRMIIILAMILSAGVFFSCERNDFYGNEEELTPYDIMNMDFSTGPSVMNVTSTNANGIYGAGVSIAIDVEFSDIVIVTGTPYLLLDTTVPGSQATYSGGSSTSILTFTYTVAAGEDSPDLDYLSILSLRLNGGDIIEDVSGNNASLRLPTPGAVGSLSYNKDIEIDTFVATAPQVIRVTSPDTDRSYGPGATLTIQVIFDAPVSVNTGGGIPTLTLETGSLDAVLNYSGGSGSATITFDYTVGPTDSSLDLNYVIPGTLALKGGTINDITDTVAALLALPNVTSGEMLADNKDIIIDSIAPMNVSSFNAAPADGEVMLTWTDPADPDFDGVTILRKVGAAISGISDPLATAICSGPACYSGMVDSGLTNGTIHYYAAYSYDAVTTPAPNYSGGATVTVVPDIYGWFVMVGANGNIMRASSPGGIWAPVSSGVVDNLNAVAHDNAGAFLAAGENDAVLYSTDQGQTWADKSGNISGWTITLTGMAYGNGWWVLTAKGGMIFYTTGIANPSPAWGSMNLAGSNDLRSVTYCPSSNIFVVVGNAGTSFVSDTSDPSGTWTDSSVGGSNLIDISFYDSGPEFIAVGMNGTINFSSNGISWIPDGLGLSSDYYTVIGGNYWMAAGNNVMVYDNMPYSGLFSDAGAVSGIFYDSAYSGFYYVMVGSAGTVAFTTDPTDGSSVQLNTQGVAQWNGVAWGN